MTIKIKKTFKIKNVGLNIMNRKSLQPTNIESGVCIPRGRWIRTTGLLHPYGFEACTQNPPGSSTLTTQLKF